MKYELAILILMSIGNFSYLLTNYTLQGHTNLVTLINFRHKLNWNELFRFLLHYSQYIRINRTFLDGYVKIVTPAFSLGIEVGVWPYNRWGPLGPHNITAYGNLYFCHSNHFSPCQSIAARPKQIAISYTLPCMYSFIFFCRTKGAPMESWLWIGIG